MKLLVMYRPYSEFGRRVEEFVHEFTRRYPQNHLEILNLDTREGSAMASLYDITRYPAILALRNDGSANMIWQGEVLPQLDEVAGYTLD